MQRLCLKVGGKWYLVLWKIKEPKLCNNYYDYTEYTNVFTLTLHKTKHMCETGCILKVGDSEGMWLTG